MTSWTSRLETGRRRLAAAAGLAALTLAALVAPTTTESASAEPTQCDPHHSWVKLVNRSRYLQVDRGDVGTVERNRTSHNMRITDNYTFTVGSRATRSTTTGSNVDVGVAVGWFNAGAGYQRSENQAMERSHSFTTTISRNITLSPGEAAVAYAGDRFAKAFAYKRHCSGDGQRVITDWSGRVRGPLFRERGWVLCSKTRLC